MRVGAKVSIALAVGLTWAGSLAAAGRPALPLSTKAAAPVAPAKAAALPQPWTEADRDATAYVLAQAAKVRTLNLDLSNPKVAHFLRRHFERSGMTADRYPGLHALMTTQARTMTVKGPAAPRTTVLSNDMVYQDTATVVLSLYPSTTPQTYTATAAASMEQASLDPSQFQLAYTSLCFYDTNSQPIGTCVRNNSFGSGQYFPTTNSVTTPDQSFTAVLAATYFQPSTGRYVPQLSTLSADEVAPPQGQSITGPVIVHMHENQGFGASLVCVSRAVNTQVTPTGGICDYGTYQQTDVLVTIGGNVTYTAAQVPPVDGNGNLIGTASVSMINTTQGGQCILSPTMANGFFASPTTYTNKVLTWNFANLDFGGGAALLCGGNGTNIVYNLVIQTTDTANNNNRIVASQTSVAGTTVPTFSGPSTMALATPTLNLVTGCLDPETIITMAGARDRRPIRLLKGEGELLRSANGGTLQVVGTVIGDDAELLAISAGPAMSIRATAKHPFVMADGSWRSADELKLGEMVRTDHGNRRISAIKRIKYGAKVHNLVLGHAVTASATVANEGFYANGFLVGGWGAQEQLAADHRARPARIRRVIPAAFRQDYENDLRDRAKN